MTKYRINKDVIQIIKKICVVGIGYIGLPTAAMFANHGFEVIGVDINTHVVEELNKGNITIEEPYLDNIVRATVDSGKLKAQTFVESADVFIIAVPTPINDDKTADMKYVESAADSILPHIKPGNIVILESTSPPGTTRDLLVPALSRSGYKIGEEILVAHTPERVLPGRILLELVENNRLIGGINEKSAKAVKELYKTFVKGEIYLTDATTAEMSKLMENTYRDVNIALANELAKICENLGINVWEVINFANKHPRVNIHTPGPGVGGHCIAVDPWFIVEKQPGLSQLITLGRSTNDSMPEYVFNKIKSLLPENAFKKRICILGVTYKPDVDDMRESPILEIIHYIKSDPLLDYVLVDPFAAGMEALESDVYTAAADSDLLVLAVNHSQFKSIDMERIFKIMKHPRILDTRNAFDSGYLEELGFDYHLLGKGRQCQ